VYNFCSQPGCADGYTPSGALLQDTDGNFYGTTAYGGTGGGGTVYSLTSGLAPFVATVPAAGKVTQIVKILGTNLTGTTSATFDGVPATFTVSSNTLISTNVPAGASTGSVQVTTPAGTLTSNASFQVKP
jgi:uncharacterized repeat protein (TIGR03803 family)